MANTPQRGRHEDHRLGQTVPPARGDKYDHRLGQTVPPADGYRLAAGGGPLAVDVSGPVLYGPDIHPVFQAGISIDEIAAEGFDFLAVKASQGTSSSWAAGAKTWLDRADALGMVTWCYHYLTTDDVNAQARTAKAASFGRPIMVDFEAGSGNVDNLRAFIAAATSIGAPIALAYLPAWYWQQVGSPSLAGLPPLVSSHYLTVTGYASTIYAQVPASFWNTYGGGDVWLLQFSDRATIAGQQIDCNAFLGSKDELRALVYGAPTAVPTPAPDPSGDDVLTQQDIDSITRSVTGAMANYPIYDYTQAQDGQPPPVMPWAIATAWGTAHAAFARSEIAALQATVDQLADALATQQGIDPTELRQAIADAIADTVTVSGELTLSPSTPTGTGNGTAPSLPSPPVTT